MRRFTSSSPSWSASSTAARVDRVEALVRPFRPRDSQKPVDVGPDHRRLRIRVSHPLETVQLAFGLLSNGFGHARARNLLAVFVRNRAVVFAQLLADGVHLTAQEVLPLLLLRAVFDVIADALSDLQFRESLSLELDRQLEALDDVEGFEELELLAEVQVRRVARRVGQCARRR